MGLLIVSRTTTLRIDIQTKIILSSDLTVYTTGEKRHDHLAPHLRGFLARGPSLDG